MSKKILAGSLLLLLCSCGGTSPAKPTDAPPGETSMNTPTAPAGIGSDEQEVYAALFAENPGITLLLQDAATDSSMTSPQAVMDFVKAELPSVDDETVTDYWRNNGQASQFSDGMNVGVEYQLLSADELAEISSQPDWGNLLKEKYPNSGGYMFFSRIGFNPARSQALVHVGVVYGPLNGGGAYYLLERKDGSWVIVGKVIRTIS